MYMCFGASWVLILFMDDNARPHRANIVDECLHLEDITNMDWRALTGLEYNRACVGYAWPTNCSPSTPSPTSLPELGRALLDEWIPQDQIDNLILSMSRCCKACTASSGRHTPH
ncbi:DDE_3 domain-containing protein [Trichonephila clavipes]|nr:DDE_3 domain-containing protein [Trichonephila clavipes]